MTKDEKTAGLGREMRTLDSWITALTTLVSAVPAAARVAEANNELGYPMENNYSAMKESMHTVLRDALNRRAAVIDIYSQIICEPDEEAVAEF